MSQSGPGHYEPIESASIDEVRDLQMKRLGDTLSHAYANVAHYRHAFDSAGVAPAGLQDLDSPSGWSEARPDAGRATTSRGIWPATSRATSV